MLKGVSGIINVRLAGDPCCWADHWQASAIGKMARVR